MYSLILKWFPSKHSQHFPNSRNSHVHFQHKIPRQSRAHTTSLLIVIIAKNSSAGSIKEYSSSASILPLQTHSHPSQQLLFATGTTSKEFLQFTSNHLKLPQNGTKSPTCSCRALRPSRRSTKRLFRKHIYCIDCAGECERGEKYWSFWHCGCVFLEQLERVSFASVSTSFFSWGWDWANDCGVVCKE